MTVRRRARLGFAVVKVSVGEVPYWLMRANPRWKDISFIGGHEKPRDGGDLNKTARRELWEEVPSVRGYAGFELEQLTELLHYGPIRSLSKGDEVDYVVQFFLLKIENSPEAFVESLSSRSRNVWIPEYDLLSSNRYRISALVQLLENNLANGIRGIPYSFSTNLRPLAHRFEQGNMQLEFALK